MDASTKTIMEEIKELQEIELSILLDVKKVCEEHKITFFLGEGTLLGAVRHKGFIPWDDDVDLIMPRDQYEKFLKVAPKALGEKYEVQHPTTVKNYWSPFIKIRLLVHDTKFAQQHISHLSKNNGPYIDIFPMEYSDKKDGFQISKTAFLIRYYRGMLSYKLGIRKPPHFYGKILKFISFFYSVDRIHEGLRRTLLPYDEPGKKYMATFLSYHPLKGQIVDAKNYGEVLEWDFEEYKMPIPIGYHEILTTIYGDYMTPPPEDKRILKHHFYSAE